MWVILGCTGGWAPRPYMQGKTPWSLQHVHPHSCSSKGRQAWARSLPPECHTTGTYAVAAAQAVGVLLTVARGPQDAFTLVA